MLRKYFSGVVSKEGRKEGRKEGDKEERILCEMMDMLTGLTVVIISQCTHISKHQAVCLKYIPFLFVNYTLVKLEGEKIAIWDLEAILSPGENKVFF